ncbi:Hypothetical predicted protein [Podarcis lilfordi]|uniref:Uncharacterized protein n=1 Tax=Podarcis lilfordi TaxID=74358 RepID=A0AA35KMM1_9SAUR|nr:Hypothetical predicted protein [Podarcis lilfordi]
MKMHRAKSAGRGGTRGKDCLNQITTVLLSKRVYNHYNCSLNHVFHATVSFPDGTIEEKVTWQLYLVEDSPPPPNTSTIGKIISHKGRK